MINWHTRALASGLALAAAVMTAFTFAGPAQADTATCHLSVPAAPLSAAGLATPYRLRGCSERNVNTSAFVEAAVINTDNGNVGIYHPLVVTGDDRPAAAPVAVKLPEHSVVGIWFGFNGDTLGFTGPGAQNVVGGFGQFGYINAPAFFKAANAAIKAHQLVVPPLGTAKDGLACPSTRDFSVVDQDQSDNLATAYRVIDGKLAQDTAATAAGQKLTNGSDEGLLAKFIDPALGCVPWTAPDLDNPGTSVPALALNELSAAVLQGAPVALVPLSDPMVLVGNKFNLAKTDRYRAGVDQLPYPALSPTVYCANLKKVAPARFALDAPLLSAATAPDGSVLLNFLKARYSTSLGLLHCGTKAH